MKTTCLVLAGLYVWVGGLAQTNCMNVPTPTPTGSPTPSPSPTPPPSAAQEIIIDNLDPESVVVAGDWETVGSDDGNGSYGPDFLYHFSDQVNVGIVRFTPTITTAGSYTVYIYWSAGSNRTTAQPVVVHDAAGNTTYNVNLQQDGNQWYELGSHTFNAGTGGYIEFNTNTSAAGYCNADAVRLVPDF
ncbi:MAG: golvesin C-terminal-like domain-containing protein [Planctomycetota bacterium]|jgi:hypothetical protein